MTITDAVTEISRIRFQPGDIAGTVTYLLEELVAHEKHAAVAHLKAVNAKLRTEVDALKAQLEELKGKP